MPEAWMLQFNDQTCVFFCSQRIAQFFLMGSMRFPVEGYSVHGVY